MLGGVGVGALAEMNTSASSRSSGTIDYAWPRLLALDGDALFDHYRHTSGVGHHPNLTKDEKRFLGPPALQRFVSARNFLPYSGSSRRRAK